MRPLCSGPLTTVLAIALGSLPVQAQQPGMALNSVADLEALQSRGYPTPSAADRRELLQLSAMLLSKGVRLRYEPEPPLTTGQRFVRHGAFMPSGEIIFSDYPLRTGALLRTLRHEAWHAVQACRRNGQPRGPLRPVGITPTSAAIAAVQARNYATRDWTLEMESFTVQEQPYVALQGLEQYCRDAG